MLPWFKQVDANRQKDAVHARALTLIQCEVCIVCSYFQALTKLSSLTTFTLTACNLR